MICQHMEAWYVSQKDKRDQLKQIIPLNLHLPILKRHVLKIGLGCLFDGMTLRCLNEFVPLYWGDIPACPLLIPPRAWET